MYEDIREQIEIGKEERQQKLILGDFNAKIGAAIEGNKTQVTKGGRQLLKLANKENMIILNTVKEKCKGVWTRVQGEEKSITDYVLTDTASAKTIKEMKIDEKKQYGWHKLQKNTATYENKKDHNPILINLDFETPTEKQRSKKITKKDIKIQKSHRRRKCKLPIRTSRKATTNGPQQDWEKNIQAQYKFTKRY